MAYWRQANSNPTLGPFLNMLRERLSHPNATHQLEWGLTCLMSVCTRSDMTTRSELAECMSCLCSASRSAARGITGIFDEHMRPHGLRTTQFTVLVNLVLRGPTALGALAKHLGLERTTLTRNLAALAENGWTRDDVDELDSRSHIISVTPAGEDVVREAFGAWRSAQQHVASILGGSDVEAIRRVSRLPFRK
jgi:DNA-binding MarR family transcriptional regulator